MTILFQKTNGMAELMLPGKLDLKGFGNAIELKKEKEYFTSYSKSIYHSFDLMRHENSDIRGSWFIYEKDSLSGAFKTIYQLKFYH